MTIFVITEDDTNKEQIVVTQINGNKYVSLGLRVFSSDMLGEVCEEHGISNDTKQLILDALSNVNECTDLLALVESNPAFLKYVEQTPELCLAAVKQNGYNLRHVAIQTEEICLESVKQNGLAIHLVEYQTPNICLAAVGNNANALYYVYNKTPEICLSAVKQNGYALHFIKDQTYEICLAAAEQNTGSIDMILDNEIKQKIKEKMNLR